MNREIGDDEDDYQEKLDKVPLRSPSERSLPKEYDEVFAPNYAKQ